MSNFNFIHNYYFHSLFQKDQFAVESGSAVWNVLSAETASISDTDSSQSSNIDDEVVSFSFQQACYNILYVKAELDPKNLD